MIDISNLWFSAQKDCNYNFQFTDANIHKDTLVYGYDKYGNFHIHVKSVTEPPYESYRDTPEQMPIVIHYHNHNATVENMYADSCSKFRRLITEKVGLIARQILCEEINEISPITTQSVAAYRIEFHKAKEMDVRSIKIPDEYIVSDMLVYAEDENEKFNIHIDSTNRNDVKHKPDERLRAIAVKIVYDAERRAIFIYPTTDAGDNTLLEDICCNMNNENILSLLKETRQLFKTKPNTKPFDSLTIKELETLFTRSQQINLLPVCEISSDDETYAETLSFIKTMVSQCFNIGVSDNEAGLIFTVLLNAKLNPKETDK